MNIFFKTLVADRIKILENVLKSQLVNTQMGFKSNPYYNLSFWDYQNKIFCCKFCGSSQNFKSNFFLACKV